MFPKRQENPRAPGWMMQGPARPQPPRRRMGINEPARRPRPVQQSQPNFLRPRPMFHAPMQQPQATEKKKSSILSQLKTEDGQWDLDKIMKTGSQLQKLYGQVSPLIFKFIKK